MHLEVARQIGYLLLVILMIFLVLRNCKRNGGHGQTNGSVNGAGDGDGDTGSSQIAMTPTSLTLTTEVKMHL